MRIPKTQLRVRAVDRNRGSSAFVDGLTLPAVPSLFVEGDSEDVHPRSVEHGIGSYAPACT